MVEIKLGNNNAFKWVNDGTNYAIGYAFYKDKLLNTEEILNLVNKQKDVNELIGIIKSLNGAFSIVIKQDNSYYLITDIIASFPILYVHNKTHTLISDDINNFTNSKLNENNIEELLSLRVCSNNKTVYNDIFQVPTSTITIISNNKPIQEIKYFTYKCEEIINKKEEVIFKEMYKLYQNAVRRLIAFANNRTIVVPLSGGYDSRLIAYHLRENNYNNVICYTYGNRTKNPEYQTAKKVADYLKYPLYFVEYRHKEMQRKYYDKREYKKIADYFGRGKSIPVIQEYFAIDNLIKNGIINQDCVVAPGYLGDFLAGLEISNDELIKDEHNTTNNLKEYILKHSYRFYSFNEDTKKYFEKEISKSINSNLNNKQIETKEIANMLEIFDLNERESKYIANAVRAYEYYKMKWYIVYSDKELMEYFRNINYKDKADRKQYIRYVEKYYKELLDYAPIAQIYGKNKKVSKNIIIRNLNRIKIMYSTYYNHYINLYGFLKLKDYLKHYLHKRTSVISIMGQDYANYLKNNELK